MSTTSDIYLDFICMRRSLRGNTTMPTLDPLEERLLEMIASSNKAAEYLSVTDLISTSELGSPTTLHSRLTSLRTKGWVQLAYTSDARKRHLQITAAGLRYLDTLAKCMILSVG